MYNGQSLQGLAQQEVTRILSQPARIVHLSILRAKSNPGLEDYNSIFSFSPSGDAIGADTVIPEPLPGLSAAADVEDTTKQTLDTANSDDIFSMLDVEDLGGDVSPGQLNLNQNQLFAQRHVKLAYASNEGRNKDMQGEDHMGSTSPSHVGDTSDSPQPTEAALVPHQKQPHEGMPGGRSTPGPEVISISHPPLPSSSPPAPAISEGSNRTTPGEVSKGSHLPAVRPSVIKLSPVSRADLPVTNIDDVLDSDSSSSDMDGMSNEGSYDLTSAKEMVSLHYQPDDTTPSNSVVGLKFDQRDLRLEIPLSSSTASTDQKSLHVAEVHASSDLPQRGSYDDDNKSFLRLLSPGSGKSSARSSLTAITPLEYSQASSRTGSMDTNALVTQALVNAFEELEKKIDTDDDLQTPTEERRKEVTKKPTMLKPPATPYARQPSPNLSERVRQLESKLPLRKMKSDGTIVRVFPPQVTSQPPQTKSTAFAPAVTSQPPSQIKSTVFTPPVTSQPPSQTKSIVFTPTVTSQLPSQTKPTKSRLSPRPRKARSHSPQSQQSQESPSAKSQLPSSSEDRRSRSPLRKFAKNLQRTLSPSNPPETKPPTTAQQLPKSQPLTQLQPPLSHTSPSRSPGFTELPKMTGSSHLPVRKAGPPPHPPPPAGYKLKPVAKGNTTSKTPTQKTSDEELHTEPKAVDHMAPRPLEKTSPKVNPSSVQDILPPPNGFSYGSPKLRTSPEHQGSQVITADDSIQQDSTEAIGGYSHQSALPGYGVPLVNTGQDLHLDVTNVKDPVGKTGLKTSTTEEKPSKKQSIFPEKSFLHGTEEMAKSTTLIQPSELHNNSENETEESISTVSLSDTIEMHPIGSTLPREFYDAPSVTEKRLMHTDLAPASLPDVPTESSRMAAAHSSDEVDLGIPAPVVPPPPPLPTKIDEFSSADYRKDLLPEPVLPRVPDIDWKEDDDDYSITTVLPPPPLPDEAPPPIPSVPPPGFEDDDLDDWLSTSHNIPDSLANVLSQEQQHGMTDYQVVSLASSVVSNQSERTEDSGYSTLRREVPQADVDSTKEKPSLSHKFSSLMSNIPPPVIPSPVPSPVPQSPHHSPSPSSSKQSITSSTESFSLSFTTAAQSSHSSAQLTTFSPIPPPTFARSRSPPALPAAAPPPLPAPTNIPTVTPSRSNPATMHSLRNTTSALPVLTSSKPSPTAPITRASAASEAHRLLKPAHTPLKPSLILSTPRPFSTGATKASPVSPPVLPAPRSTMAKLGDPLPKPSAFKPPPGMTPSKQIPPVSSGMAQPSSGTNTKLPSRQRSENEPFQVEVLKGLMGVGIKVQAENNGHVIVSHIQPGGPVSRNGNIRSVTKPIR